MFEGRWAKDVRKNKTILYNFLPGTAPRLRSVKESKGETRRVLEKDMSLVNLNNLHVEAAGGCGPIGGVSGGRSNSSSRKNVKKKNQGELAHLQVSPVRSFGERKVRDLTLDLVDVVAGSASRYYDTMVHE